MTAPPSALSTTGILSSAGVAGLTECDFAAVAAAGEGRGAAADATTAGVDDAGSAGGVERDCEAGGATAAEPDETSRVMTSPSLKSALI